MPTFVAAHMFCASQDTSTQQLVSFIFGCGWLGWKWIATLTNWPVFFFFFQVPSEYFENIAKN